MVSLFFEWILLGSMDCFTQNESFIEMCSHFAEDPNIIEQMIAQDISIVEPTSYDELCYMVCNSIKLSEADFYTPDYIELYKYLVDSLVHHYHINFSPTEITEYMYRICNIVNNQWEEHNA